MEGERDLSVLDLPLSKPGKKTMKHIPRILRKREKMSPKIVIDTKKRQIKKNHKENDRKMRRYEFKREHTKERVKRHQRNIPSNLTVVVREPEDNDEMTEWDNANVTEIRLSEIYKIEIDVKTHSDLERYLYWIAEIRRM